MHSRPKEQREAVRNLVHSVLTRDMGTFNPERFKDWIKDIDARFRKVGLTLLFEIRSRTVHFTIKEIRSGRTAYKFHASTHVPVRRPGRRHVGGRSPPRAAARNRPAVRSCASPERKLRFLAWSSNQRPVWLRISLDLPPWPENARKPRIGSINGCGN